MKSYDQLKPVTDERIDKHGLVGPKTVDKPQSQQFQQDDSTNTRDSNTPTASTTPYQQVLPDKLEGNKYRVHHSDHQQVTRSTRFQ